MTDDAGSGPTEFDGPVSPPETSGVANLLEEGGPLEPQDVAAVEEGVSNDPLEAALQEAAERTADLQRLQAEYANYRKRVDRDRQLIKENAAYAALLPIIEVLDSIDRARAAGEVDGGFKTVADQLERVVASAGLTRFGEPGDAFDPMLHEALSHMGTDPEVAVPTAKFVAKAGYRMGDRVVRAAQVIVVDPAAEAPEANHEDTGN